MKMRVALKDPAGSVNNANVIRTTARRRRWWGRTATSTTASSATLSTVARLDAALLRQPHADQDARRLRLGQHRLRRPGIRWCRRTPAARRYLIFTKYNNYAGFDGGDGVNKIAVLDPNATMVEPHPSSNGQCCVMKEVLTVAGSTPDPDSIAQFPNAVREWCINTAAVDPFHQVGAGQQRGRQAVPLGSHDQHAAERDHAVGRHRAKPTRRRSSGRMAPSTRSTGRSSTPSGRSRLPTPSPTATPTCIPGANNGISGQVRYYSNGQPGERSHRALSGATSASVQTDAAGQFAFTGLNGCSFHVEAREAR